MFKKCWKLVLDAIWITVSMIFVCWYHGWPFLLSSASYLYIQQKMLTWFKCDCDFTAQSLIDHARQCLFKNFMHLRCSVQMQKLLFSRVSCQSSLNQFCSACVWQNQSVTEHCSSKAAQLYHQLLNFGNLITSVMMHPNKIGWNSAKSRHASTAFILTAWWSVQHVILSTFTRQFLCAHISSICFADWPLEVQSCCLDWCLHTMILNVTRIWNPWINMLLICSAYLYRHIIFEEEHFQKQLIFLSFLVVGVWYKVQISCCKGHLDF